MCPTPRDFPQKKLYSSVQVLLSYRCVKTAFTWFLSRFQHLSVALDCTWPHGPLSCVLICTKWIMDQEYTQLNQRTLDIHCRGQWNKNGKINFKMVPGITVKVILHIRKCNQIGCIFCQVSPITNKEQYSWEANCYGKAHTYSVRLQCPSTKCFALKACSSQALQSCMLDISSVQHCLIVHSTKCVLLTI